MSSFPILDLVAGMIFIFFMLSIISSSAVEIVLTTGKYRSKMLEEWLRNIFDKDVTLPGGKVVPLGQALMDHCSITALSRQGKSPSYIDARNFASALLEKVTYDPANPHGVAKGIDDLVRSIENSTSLPSDLQRILLAYAYEAKDGYRSVAIKTAGEIELFKSKIENWFDTSMERVSGAMKTRYSRRFTFLTAVIITVLLNADSISIGKYLYSNPEARIKMAAQAYAAVDNDTIKKQVNHIILAKQAVTDSLTRDTTRQLVTEAARKAITDTIMARIDDIKMTKAILDDGIPLGWNRNVFNDNKGVFYFPLILLKILGLAATVLAIMMGAPFWFDVLNKIANLRGAGKKPEEAEKK